MLTKNVRGKPYYGEDYYIVAFPPEGKGYYISCFQGGKATMGENCYTTPAHI